MLLEISLSLVIIIFSLNVKKIFKQAFYSVAGLPLVRHLGRPWRGRACVLCYHRVLPDDEFESGNKPNSNLIMPTSRFAEQMEFLSENFKVISMDDLTGHHGSSSFSDSNEFVVVVTFDDGYKDNLTYALPVLEQYNIPAVIYITTRFLEGDAWMWWYELWDYIEETDLLEVNFFEISKKWNTEFQNQKISCFNELKDLFLKYEYEKQKEVMQKITSFEDRKQYLQLCLNWEEVKILDRHPLITIGSHSHSHPNLKILTEEKAFSEMYMSKSLLEERLEHSVHHFAYPYGTVNEANIREFELASCCGYRSAVTTQTETIWSPTLLAIPRLGVPSYLTVQGLKGKLSGWEHLTRKLIFRGT